MAITETIEKRSLQLHVEDGHSADGSIKLKARTYNNVKEEAANEDILAVGSALGGLMQETVHKIVLSEKTELAEA